MRAIVQDVYGSADQLRLAEVDKPVIAADEVLVQVHAAGVDRGTCHLMRGEPYLVRILGFGFRGPKNRVPGLDVAGTVAAVGGDVSRFKVGDEVFGISRGSFAEYAAAREDKLVRKPAGLSFEQAAVVAVSGLAALQGLHAGRITAGQKVLIIGASGGSAATPCSSPRPSEPRLPGWPAPRKPACSARSAPTRLSTTPGRTSPTAASIMT
jgi:NADPH:quinone reductase-like Zn-dependent oxidoreductase